MNVIVVTFLWPSPATLTAESVNLDSESMLPLKPCPVNWMNATVSPGQRVGGDRVAGLRQGPRVEARHLGRGDLVEDDDGLLTAGDVPGHVRPGRDREAADLALTLIVRPARAGLAEAEAEDDAEDEQGAAGLVVAVRIAIVSQAGNIVRDPGTGVPRRYGTAAHLLRSATLF